MPADKLSEERERWLCRWAKNRKIGKLPANQGTEIRPESWIRYPRDALRRCKRELEVGMSCWGRRKCMAFKLCTPWEKEPRWSKLIELQLDALTVSECPPASTTHPYLQLSFTSPQGISRLTYPTLWTTFCALGQWQVRHFTSLGYLRITTGIPVGKPMGMETRGSEYLSSQVYTDLGSSSGCCKYLPQVLVRLRFYLSILLIWFNNIKFTRCWRNPFFFIKMVKCIKNTKK